MITEKRLEEALKYLADTDEEHAKLTAGVDYLKDLAKALKGKFIINCEDEKSVAMKEHAGMLLNNIKIILMKRKMFLKRLQY
jgi:hypothetical protein